MTIRSMRGVEQQFGIGRMLGDGWSSFERGDVWLLITCTESRTWLSQLVDPHATRVNEH